MKEKTKKQIIGFDFDKVFVDYPPLVPTKIIDFLYKKRNGNLSYRFPNSLEQKIRILSHFPLFRHPIKNNVKILGLLSDNKHELHLISSRFSFLEKRTKAWLEKNNFSRFFRGTHFNFEDHQPHLFKSEVIKKLGIEKFVDDDLDLLLFLTQKNPIVKLFWISPYKSKSVLPKNITHIKNLEDFFEKYL